jgi:predicted nucleotidyltransferase
VDGYGVRMRAIPEFFDPVVVAEIDRRLDDVEVEHGVAISWCVESGSRAWGFPSQDSDYDSRFVFVRSEDAYLSPWLDRDVIETPLDAIYDVNGWDLRKAIQLLVKGNAVVIEWLSSPIVYRGAEVFRAEMLALAADVADRDAIGRHYTHVCLNQWTRHGDGVSMPLKRLFYAVRPAASIRWLEQHPELSTPPMQIQQLLEQNEAPAPVVEAVRRRAADVFRHLVRTHGPSGAG